MVKALGLYAKGVRAIEEHKAIRTEMTQVLNPRTPDQVVNQYQEVCSEKALIHIKKQMARAHKDANSKKNEMQAHTVTAQHT